MTDTPAIVTVWERAPLRVIAKGNALPEQDRAHVALSIRPAGSARLVELALLSRLRKCVRIFQTLGTSPGFHRAIWLCPEVAARSSVKREQDSRPAQSPSMNRRRPPLGATDRLAKRAFDIVVAMLALTTLAPAMILIGLTIRMTSPGPVIFKQTRRGLKGRAFKIWKFRTMTVAEDGPDLRQVVRGDHRITRAGRWLRRMSLDELPQLVNVLSGEMSLIGPRPHALAHDDAYCVAISEYALRRRVKPGLTGAAQATGLRGETPTLDQMRARVRCDLWYIENWSMWLDIRIAFQTLNSLFKYEAY